jgi:hypothetical protein
MDMALIVVMVAFGYLMLFFGVGIVRSVIIVKKAMRPAAPARLQVVEVRRNQPVRGLLN